MSPAPVRVLALWSPDWPVTAAARAAHVPPDRPAAVVAGNRVLACSAVARAHGIRRGLRKREAQARCPELAVLTRDPDRDARAFEPVVAAVEELAPGVEIVRPGLVALGAKGPVGWFGGEQSAAERLVDQVAARTGVECQVGLADGLFAAVIAARRGVAVAPGATPAFLAPLGVEELDREPDVDRSELVGLLHRLGLRSLGAFGALDAQDVASRFGADAVLGHRLTRGLDPRPPVRRRPPGELSVEIELDPPVDRVDAAAFAARGLAEQLHSVLAGHGLSCTRLGVGARTVGGVELHRIWRCAEPLTPAGTVDRVRWQLDAWLTQRARLRSPAAFAGAAVSDGELASSLTHRARLRSPAAFAGAAVSDGEVGGPEGLSRLWLVPEETVAAGALQLGLWGEVGEADERAGRVLVRVQALLGPEAVVTAVLVGGRDPAEQVRLVPWGDERNGGVFVPERVGSGSVSGAGAGAVIGGSEPLTALRAVEGSGTVIGGASAPDGDRAAEPSAARCAAVGSEPVTTTPAGVRRVAPAGWPDDVVRRTGRISAAEIPPGSVIAGSEPLAAPDAAERSGSAISADQALARPAARGRSSNRRRRLPPRRSTGRPVREPPPSWPGRLPTPSPATVPPQPVPAELVDSAAGPVRLTAPDLLTAPPHRVAVDGGRFRQVRGWAGPWPLRQRWWSPDGVEGSRLQVVLAPEHEDDEVALLLLIRDGRWWVTGVYD